MLRDGLGDSITEVDIVFNSTFTWDYYRGALRPPPDADTRRVAIHELGHLLGLGHPDQVGQSVTAIVNSGGGGVDDLRADDIAGGQRLYGAPGYVPPNDSFANATKIGSSIVSLHTTEGTNIAASREPNEPAHAEVAAGHSVWWKWTATEAIRLKVDAYGSNFDSVLAVYTGSSLQSLNLIGANDDEELAEDNPTATRKRSSLVEFNTVVGTDYSIAVDGWGDPDRLTAGSTGSVTLRLSVGPLHTAPTFTQPPQNRIVSAGSTAIFDAHYNGYPDPVPTWQYLAVGTSTWSDIVNNDIYRVGWSLGGRSQLSVRTAYSMNGDQFRCVATNSMGSGTSMVAALEVSPIPLPTITAQSVRGGFPLGDWLAFQVEVSNQGDIQWFHNGVPLAGETRSSLGFDSLQLSDACDYHVVVTNPGGSVTSNTSHITVLAAPLVSNLGTARRVVAAEATLEFAVSAVGNGTISYQWFHNGRALPGGTRAALTQRIEPRAQSGAYWVTATDQIGTRQGAPFFRDLGSSSDPDRCLGIRVTATRRPE